MSLKPKNSQQKDALYNSDFLVSDTRVIQKRSWRNTWSYRLHWKIPLDDKFDYPVSAERAKKIIRKYYGKKILYIFWPQDLNALISRSKLLKDIRIENTYIDKNSLRSKGNLVILGRNVLFECNCFKYVRSVHVKKILKHCQEARIGRLIGQNLQILKYMPALRNLSVHIHTSHIGLLERAFRCILRLETIKMEIVGRECSKKEISKQSYRLFSKLNMLPYIKTVGFIGSYGATQCLKRDLDILSAKNLKFNFRFKIFVDDKLIEADESLWKVIRKADGICIEDWRICTYLYSDCQMNLKKQQTRKSDKKNIVEISMKCFAEETFNEEPNKKKLLIPVLQLFRQIKEECHCLQSLSLSLTTLSWIFSNDVSTFHKELNQTLQEISNFDKLESFCFSANPEEMKICPLDKILSNKSLETFQLKLSYYNGKDTIFGWESLIMATDQIKEIYLNVVRGSKAPPLFRADLLNCIQRLDHLEVVELIDGRLELIAFDFFYGLVTNLLDKKNMKRICICTKVINTVYSANFGDFLSKSLGSQLKNMLNEISQDWEMKVKALKEAAKLEEIVVGKLSHYGFSYLFYSKAMEIFDKLFWKESDMEELLSRNSQLESSHREAFRLFRSKKVVELVG